jgi:hypothetical protein
MKVVLTIMLNAVCFLCFAQKQLDFGEVKANGNYTTIAQKDKSICTSAYQLEISLTRAWLLMGRYENVNLTFDGWKWRAVKLKGNLINGKTDTITVSPVINYDTLFSALKNNNVFLLDDQDLLKLNGTVDDGTEYSLSYKAGKHCRTYKFQNPEVYKKMNENVAELTNYINIARLLFEDLRERNAANTGLVK